MIEAQALANEIASTAADRDALQAEAAQAHERQRELLAIRKQADAEVAKTRRLRDALGCLQADRDLWRRRAAELQAQNALLEEEIHELRNDGCARYALTQDALHEEQAP